MTILPQNAREVTTKRDGEDHEQPPPAVVAISPFYHSSVNEITQPNSYTACSHYLTKRWKRELGPTGYAILTSFRDRCFFNRKTGELRDVIQVPIPEIADECGVSEKTVRRELAANKALQRFIRGQREPAPDPRRGGWRWGPNTFQVAMDDPIHPDDEEELCAIVRRKAEEAEKAPEDPLARARRLATLGQSDRVQKAAPAQRSDNLTGRPVNLSHRPVKLSTTSGQSDRTLKSPDSSLPENTSLTHAAPGGSLSLSGEGETDRTAPSAEEIAAVRAAIAVPSEPPKKLTSKDIEADWGALPPEGREKYRAPAIAQLRGRGAESPTDRMIDPVMFRLYWAERKGVEPLKVGRE